MALGRATSSGSARLGKAFELDLRGQERRQSGQMLQLERTLWKLCGCASSSAGVSSAETRLPTGMGRRAWGTDIFLDTDNRQRSPPQDPACAQARQSIVPPCTPSPMRASDRTLAASGTYPFSVLVAW
jgi:hypothetical protein